MPDTVLLYYCITVLLYSTTLPDTDIFITMLNDREAGGELMLDLQKHPGTEIKDSSGRLIVHHSNLQQKNLMNE